MARLKILAVGVVVALLSTSGAQARPSRHHLARHAYHASGGRPANGIAPWADAPSVHGGAVAVAMRYLNSLNPTGTRGPWCADFMNLLEHRMGRKGIKSRMAPDWARYGRPSGPVYDSIAVFRGHVARVIRRVGNVVEAISGNDRHHRVGIGRYPLSSVIAFRVP